MPSSRYNVLKIDLIEADNRGISLCNMQSETSVHDNNVYAYTVDCEGQKLVLYTEYLDREPYEFTDIVFCNVVAHYLEYSLQKNILFDVEEVELGSIVSKNAGLFERSSRYGWPPIKYGGDLDKLLYDLRVIGSGIFCPLFVWPRRLGSRRRVQTCPT